MEVSTIKPKICQEWRLRLWPGMALWAGVGVWGLSVGSGSVMLRAGFGVVSLGCVWGELHFWLVSNGVHLSFGDFWS